MSGFPIANAIRAGITPQPPFAGYGAEVIETVDWATVLNEAAFFDFSIAASLYWQGKQDYYHLEEDFGPLRAPYPTVWAEWAIPHRVMIEGVEVDSPMCGMRWAALIQEVPFDSSAIDVDRVMATPQIGPSLGGDGGEMDRAAAALQTAPKRIQRMLLGAVKKSGLEFVNSRITLFLLRNDGVPVMIPFLKGIMLDPKTGRYVKGSVVDMPAQSYQRDEHALRMAKELVGGHVNAAWMALTLINCRNVTTREQGQVFPRSGRDKRIGTPIVKYHTIVLPNEKSRSSSPARRKSADASLALHRVRGHFKTFTAESPLMGKHVGTYWWGWQVRGNKDNGVVVSDYKLGVAS